MGILRLYRRFVIRRRIAAERKLREKCVVYAGNSNIVQASMIYRFIVKGTNIERDPYTGETVEYVFPNLVGVIHQVESQEK